MGEVKDDVFAPAAQRFDPLPPQTVIKLFHRKSLYLARPIGLGCHDRAPDNIGAQSSYDGFYFGKLWHRQSRSTLEIGFIERIGTLNIPRYNKPLTMLLEYDIQ